MKRSKQVRMAAVICAVAALCSLAWGKYDGGSGTASDPYVIRTVEAFNAIGNSPDDWAMHFRLEADLDLATLQEPFHIIGNEQSWFTGTFDGGGHSIANFVCPYAEYGMGMFGFTRGATLKRVILINPRTEVEWAISIGTLVGQQIEGTVDACASEGGFVSGSYFVGGLVGRCYSGTIARCYSTCTVEGRQTAEDIGGLVGRGERCNVSNCYACGNVSGLHYVGGLIGRTMSGGSVTHCYAAGRVTCAQDPWGIPDAGGLIGVVDRTFVTRCFWDTQTSGFKTSAAGHGLSTAELYMASTFILAGWDLWGETKNGAADFWSIEEGKDYPRLFRQPIVTPVRTWTDDFENDDPVPLWQVNEAKPDAARIQEINGRLEMDTPIPGGSATALYVASGWMLDSTKDFSLKVDFRFDANTAGEGWVSIGLTPSPTSPASEYIELTAGCLDGEPLYTGRQATGGGKQRWWAARRCDSGTLYISYDATKDELYRSFAGYGPVNSWNTATGLIKELWSGRPLYVIIGGGSTGMAMSGADTWLDDFAVDGGAVVP